MTYTPKQYIKTKVKKWLGITQLENENKMLRQLIMKQADRVTNRIDELDKLTTMDVDVGVRGPCTVILSGVFRGKGYVTFYEVEHQEFQYIVEEYRHRRRSGHLRNIDSIPYHRGGSFTL